MNMCHKERKTGRLNFVVPLFFITATLMLVVTLVVSFYIHYMEEAVEDNIQNHLIAAAQAASTFLTVEELDLFHTEEDMERPEWEALRARLMQFAADFRVLYVYYWRLHGDSQIQYIIDNDEDEEWMVTPALIFDIDDDPATAEAVPLLMAGERWVSDIGTYTTSWDGLISGLAPVFNADGSIYCAAGVDLSDEIIINQRNSIRSMRIVLIASLFLSILSGILGMGSYRKKAIQSESASQAKSRFLSTMSHEIRTPLNAVIGLADIVLHRGRLLPESKNDIQQIHHSGTTLLGIINDLLDISKIEAGGFELVPVEYVTAEFINDTVNLNMVRIGSKPVDFVLELGGDLPRKLYGDELRIKQVLNNIVSNAIKYTREGKVTLNVGWVPFGESVQLCFKVQDTGIGIQKDDICRLFTDYTQFNITANRKTEGTGLGMAITKKLVQMMGGDITVESEYGKGSTFTVTLVQSIVDMEPIGEKTAEELRLFQYESTGEKEIIRSWMPYGRVLVVDDMQINLQVVQGLLEPYGLKVETAQSGNEAINLFQAMSVDKSYDLIFMDHMMPGMDGIETVKIIRDLEQELGVEPAPIIALTANAVSGMREMFLEKGFNDFLAKPIDLALLDKVLNEWVGDKKKPEILQQANKEIPPESPSLDSVSEDSGAGSLPVISGIDTAKGLKMTGNKKNFYIKILRLFCKEIKEKLSLLQTSTEATIVINQIHSIKGISGSIGADALSARAAELEVAGKAGNTAFVYENLAGFVEQIEELERNINNALINYKSNPV